MEPFDKYPKEWSLDPPPQREGSNCRHGYGLKLVRETGQTRCAYCGLPLWDSYEHWLLMAVDHVVPIQAGKGIGIDEKWLASWANCVLACSVCNLFRNRFKFDRQAKPSTWAEFLKLRDETFDKRKKEVEKIDPHRQECEFYLAERKKVSPGS